MFYNQTLFKKLKLTPPTTYPQLVHVASVIKSRSKVQPLTEGGKDTIAIRPMMYVALTYDHRLVDGRQSVTFLVKLKEALEDPSRILLEI